MGNHPRKKRYMFLSLSLEGWGRGRKIKLGENSFNWGRRLAENGQYTGNWTLKRFRGRTKRGWKIERCDRQVCRLASKKWYGKVEVVWYDRTRRVLERQG